MLNEREALDHIRSRLEDPSLASRIRDLTILYSEDQWSTHTSIKLNFMIDDLSPILFETNYYERVFEGEFRSNTKYIDAIIKLMDNALIPESLEYIGNIIDIGFDPNLVFKHMTDAKVFNKVHYHDVDALTSVYETLMSPPTEVNHNKAKELRGVYNHDYKHNYKHNYKYSKLGINVIIEGHMITLKIPGKEYSTSLLPSSAGRQSVIIEALEDLNMYSDFINKSRMHNLKAL